MKKKLLIFDMDGTIIDTDELLIKTREELYNLYKKDGTKFNHELIQEFSGPPLEYAINKAFPELDPHFIHDEYRKRTKKYYDTHLFIFPSTYEVLKYFHEKGIILCVLTAKNLEMTRLSLKRFALDEFFTDFVTRTSLFPPKPAPDGILYLLKKYNIQKEEAMMIGDTNYDLLAAKNASIDSCLMTMRPRKGIENKNICFKANSFLELKEIIDKYE